MGVLRDRNLTGDDATDSEQELVDHSESVPDASAALDAVDAALADHQEAKQESRGCGCW